MYPDVVRISGTIIPELDMKKKKTEKRFVWCLPKFNIFFVRGRNALEIELAISARSETVS